MMTLKFPEYPFDKNIRVLRTWEAGGKSFSVYKTTTTCNIPSHFSRNASGLDNAPWINEKIKVAHLYAASTEPNVEYYKAYWSVPADIMFVTYTYHETINELGPVGL